MKFFQKRKEAKAAKQQILEYFAKAQEVFKTSPQKANDFVRKARNLAMKYRLKLPREMKRRFCKHCYSFLVPGKNCRIRTHEGKVVYTCFTCKKFMRFVYK